MPYYVSIVLNFVVTFSISKFIVAVISGMEPTDYHLIGGSEILPVHVQASPPAQPQVPQLLPGRLCFRISTISPKVSS